jgi:hypothetical protein
MQEFADPPGLIPAPPLVEARPTYPVILTCTPDADPPWMLTDPAGAVHAFETFVDALAGHHYLCPDDSLMLGPATLAALRAELAR